MANPYLLFSVHSFIKTQIRAANCNLVEECKHTNIRGIYVNPTSVAANRR